MYVIKFNKLHLAVNMKVINQILQVSERDIEEVRSIYNKTEEDVKNDVQLLKVWMEKQLHLPQNYDENRLERILMRNKFRMEQCKYKIDSYFTLRGMYPEFFEYANTSCKGFEKVRKAVMYVPMPCLTDKKERLIITSFLPDSVDLYNFKEHFEYVLAATDLEFSHDYAATIRYIMDFKNYTIAYGTKFELNQIIKGMALYQTAYSERISEIDFLNAPKYFDIVLAMFKIAMKPKLFNKIRFRKNLDELYGNIDKKYLPVDYGGEQKSMKEIHDQMGEMLKEEIGFLAENAKLVSNENLRIGEPYKNDMFGQQGTFRKLNLD